MKLFEASLKIKAALKDRYEDGEASVIASMIIEHYTGISRNDGLLQKERELEQEEEKNIRNAIERLLQNEPVQYVTGTCWFHDLELFVDHNVLIPRPETEELVDWIIRSVRPKFPEVFSKQEATADKTSLLKILDIGTGSGCIALALKKAMPAAEVWGCDVSEAALNVARRNGAALNIRVDFQGLDFLDEQQQRQLPSVDIMVSNPPYIPASGKKDMHPNVVDHEPHLALFVPDNDPLLFYRAIAGFGKFRLHQGGVIYLELHEDLAPAVMELFRSEGYQHIELKKDMQGKDRMLQIMR